MWAPFGQAKVKIPILRFLKDCPNMWCHPLLNHGFWVFSWGSSRFACRRMTPSQPYRRATDDGHLTFCCSIRVAPETQTCGPWYKKYGRPLFLNVSDGCLICFFIFFLHSHWFYPHSCWSNIHFHCHYPNRSVSTSIGSEFLLKCQALVDTSPWTLLKFQCCHWLNLNPCWLNWHFHRSNPSIFPEIRLVLLLNSQFLLSAYRFFSWWPPLFLLLQLPLSRSPKSPLGCTPRRLGKLPQCCPAHGWRARKLRPGVSGSSRRVALVMMCWARRSEKGIERVFCFSLKFLFLCRPIWWFGYIGIYWDSKVLKVQSHINMYLHKL